MTSTMSIQLNIELGHEFLQAMLDRYGVAGWNRWIQSMVSGGHLPLSWGDCDPIPSAWYTIDLHAADLSGRNLDGIDLRLAWLKNARFDGCSLVGASLGCCPHASFRAADLRQADLTESDITACDFSDATVDGLVLSGASYAAGLPPVGLPDHLMRFCRSEPAHGADGAGLVEVPVAIRATLTEVPVA